MTTVNFKGAPTPKLGTKTGLRANGTRSYNVCLLPNVVDAVRATRHNIGYAELIRQLLNEELKRTLDKTTKKGA